MHGPTEQEAGMTADTMREKIVDTALSLAELKSWESVRLYDVASELKATLEEIRVYFREKEDIVDAWFDRADSAMLVDSGHADFLDSPPRERLHRAMMTWFSVLAAHRRPTRQMIFAKFEFGHIHYQLTGAFRVSRTVQWMRESARRDKILPHRAVEEAGLTGIYLMTFFYWMYDDSANSMHTARFLDRLLSQAETFSRRLSLCLK
jgi:AcrR family transcriptional regulator